MCFLAHHQKSSSTWSNVSAAEIRLAATRLSGRTEVGLLCYTPSRVFLKTQLWHFAFVLYKHEAVRSRVITLTRTLERGVHVLCVLWASVVDTDSSVGQEFTLSLHLILSNTFINHLQSGIVHHKLQGYKARQKLSLNFFNKCFAVNILLYVTASLLMFIPQTWGVKCRLAEEAVTKTQSQGLLRRHLFLTLSFPPLRTASR